MKKQLVYTVAAVLAAVPTSTSFTTYGAVNTYQMSGSLPVQNRTAIVIGGDGSGMTLSGCANTGFQGSAMPDSVPWDCGQNGAGNQNWSCSGDNNIQNWFCGGNGNEIKDWAFDLVGDSNQSWSCDGSGDQNWSCGGDNNIQNWNCNGDILQNWFGSSVPDWSQNGGNGQNGNGNQNGNQGGDHNQNGNENGSTDGDEFKAQVVELVNQERAKAGLSPLTINSRASAAAQTRAKEITASFSHTRPDGRNFSTALSEAGVSYQKSGENIAYGQRSPKEVMEAWMNSPSHRAAILDGSYREIGIGHYRNNGVDYWTQLFIR
ncbi:CAP domain-containing protein [Lachnospiraceae bacterium 62-35]